MSDEAEAAAQDTTDAGDTTSTTDTSAVDANAGVTETETPKDGEQAETKEAKDGEGEGSEDAGEEATEDYAEFDMPDGFELNASAMEKAVPAFKDLGLTQEQGQGLVNLFSDLQSTALADQATTAEQQVETWTNEIKTEWGPKYDDKLAVAAKGTDFFDDYLRSQLPETERTVEVEGKNGATERQPVTPFRDALNMTGAGNHPAIIKVINRVGQMIGEDGIAETIRANPDEKTTAERWYS